MTDNQPDIVAELDRWLAHVGNPETTNDARFPINVVQRARAEVVALRDALDKSVKLQAHYAKLLNDYDGGERIAFGCAQEWMDRLRALKDKR
jgi:hypothetical protein